MAMTPLAIATEDPLSEAVVLKILKSLGVDYGTPQLLGMGGSGNLKSRMKSWVQMASFSTVILLTDLDEVVCPVKLVSDWLGNYEKPDNLIFRVAVKEVEAWLLADSSAAKALLGSKLKLPNCVDELIDPKQHLLQAAKFSKKSIREELIRYDGSNVYQGLGYNNLLSGWVAEEWCPVKASELSPSLGRAINEIKRAATRHLIS